MIEIVSVQLALNLPTGTEPGKMRLGSTIILSKMGALLTLISFQFTVGTDSSPGRDVRLEASRELYSQI